MANPGSGTKAETYATVEETVQSVVTPFVVTQTEQIAQYFADDLLDFISKANIDLVSELQIPREFFIGQNYPDPALVVEMLFDDLSHMLRDALITSVHLLLSERQIDPNTGAYPLRYHAEYTIHQLQEGSGGGSGQFAETNGRLAPPKQCYLNSRFALLIDWEPTSHQRRRRVRRPLYWFDWVPEHSRFDNTTLVRYREGGLSADGAELVKRQEYGRPDQLGRR